MGNFFDLAEVFFDFSEIFSSVSNRSCVVTRLRLGKYAPIKLNFPFCKEKPLFGALLTVYQTGVWSVRCIRCHSHCKE